MIQFDTSTLYNKFKSKMDTNKYIQTSNPYACNK